MSWLTVRELDQAAGRPKGTAFRAFKALRGGLREPRDFRLLDAQRDAAEIRQLREAGRVYATSRNVLLFSPQTAQRVRDEMR